MTSIAAAHPEEKIPPGEAEDIAMIAQMSLDSLDTSERPVRRGQHAKSHGCVEARFIVEHDVPADLRVGIFAKSGTYPACIRFSNGAQDDDAKGDIHGMAIKLLNVGGEETPEGERGGKMQDFILIDHPVFFSRHARSYRALVEAVSRSRKPSRLNTLMSWARTERAQRSAYVLLSHYILGFRFHELKILRAAISKKPASPLGITYWSATPYALGNQAVKYSARAHPRPANVLEPTDMLSADRLRATMTAHLDRAEARFDFLVQVRTPPGAQKMPVEDASIAWSEVRAPFRKVATIVIPRQAFDTPEQRAACEDRSFSPWNALPEHRPLGGINRARKDVYDAISRKRHQLNRVACVEPVRSPGPMVAPVAADS